MKPLQYVHAEPTRLMSSITGRSILLNTGDKYAVVPDFSTKLLDAACTEWHEYARELRQKVEEAHGPWRVSSYTGLYDESRALIESVGSASNPREFGVALNAVIENIAHVDELADKSTARGTRKTGRRSSEARRLYDFLAILRKHGLALFPAAEMWTSNLIRAASIPPVEERFYGSAAWIQDYLPDLKWAGQARPAKILALATHGVEEAGDIDSQVIEAVAGFAPMPPTHTVYALCDLLLRAQQKAFLSSPDKMRLLPQSYRQIFKSKRAPRADRDFNWALEAGGERMALWRERVAAFLDSLVNRAGLVYEIVVLNFILDYVVADPTIPPTPVEYCRRDFSPQQTFAEFLELRSNQNNTGRSHTLRTARRFFDWLLTTEACDEHGDRLRGYRNPIDEYDIPTQEGSTGQTHRNALPIRFLRIMREILECPDADGNPTFAWAKTLEADYFDWLNPKTGQKERVWSPVRANLFLLRLLLPIRGMQARLLDSGEADPMAYRPEHGGWVKNQGRMAPGPGSNRPPMGLLRQIWDPDVGRWFTGLFISTNKTQDRDEGFTDSGYEIPWENQDVIDLYCRIRDWQEHYNPCLRLLSRAEVKSDPKLPVSTDVAERLEKLCFLFRDAASPSHPQEPPTEGRLSTFWKYLIGELEKRLAAKGLMNHDGSPIKLVTTYRENGTPGGTIFDGHSLRVAGLTALAATGVDIHVLSKFVAGHATLVMTYYYVKPGPWKISAALDEALQKLAETEVRDWDAYLKGQPLELIHDIAVYNSDDGLKAAAVTQSALWATLDDGICPNGGTKCDIGGEQIVKRKNAHAPVPGGPRNCAMCRFFVTGPAFLGGLVAKFNATGGHLREKLNGLKEAEERRRMLATQALEAELEGQIFGDYKQLTKIEEVVQSIQDELTPLAESWTAQLRLIKRVEAIIERRRGKPSCGNDLVLNGTLDDLRVSLVECTEFDLWDRICQSSVFYPSVDARLPAIRRGRAFDAMFAREGKSAAFATLNDQQLVEVGNAFATFLRTRLGDQVANDLIAGRETIRALGIEAEIDAVVARSTEPGARIDPRTLIKSASPLLLGHQGDTAMTGEAATITIGGNYA